MYLRKGNLQFLVTQDNNSRSLSIDSFRKVVDDRRNGDYFGFDEADLKGVDFKRFLPSDIIELIDDNVEFSMEGNDLKEVLSKIIHFKVVTKENKLIEMNVSAEREISDLENLKFRIILEPKIHLQEKIKSILESISSVQEVINEHTGLINESSFIEVLDEVMDFLYDSKIEGVLAVITLEGFPNFRMENGKENADEMLLEIGKIIKNNFRVRDVIGYLGFGKFAVLMVKTFEDEAMPPIKRLESSLQKNGLLNNRLTFNARFKLLDLSLDAKEELENIKNKKIDYSMSGND
ncbi:MAG TPA: hypothetical protein DIV86_07455 [Alphaproteobacteria bacterium]|nr:hypothetical protein [Alphaproteobacteria bacterium]